MNKEQRVSIKEALGIKDMSNEHLEELLGDSFKWLRENESKVGSVTRGFLKEYYPSLLVGLDTLPPQLAQGMDALSLLLFQIGYLRGSQEGAESAHEQRMMMVSIESELARILNRAGHQVIWTEALDGLQDKEAQCPR